MLKPLVSDVIPPMIAALSSIQYVKACNNSVWALGEIASKDPVNVKPWAAKIVQVGAGGVKRRKFR